MLVTTKKILLISASLIALSGSASVLAAPDQQRSSLASQQVQQQVNINTACAGDCCDIKGRWVENRQCDCYLPQGQWCF